MTVANFVVSPDQLKAVGALALADLRLTSEVFRKQPSLSRLCCSHLDDEGVKALVDAVCERCAPCRSLAARACCAAVANRAARELQCVCART